VAGGAVGDLGRELGPRAASCGGSAAVASGAAGKAEAE
jgi:hypothetical protein